MQKEIFEIVIAIYKERLLQPLPRGGTLHNYIIILVKEEGKKNKNALRHHFPHS
jgi:hypothetical protein